MFHLVTGGIMGFVVLYIFARCLAPLNIHLIFKIVLVALLSAAAFKLQISRYFTGMLSATDPPAWVLVVSGWAFALVVMLALLLLARDLSWLLAFAARGFKASAGQALLSTGQWSVLLLTLAAFIAAFGVWQAVRVPDVRKIELNLPDLPPELDGLRIVQLSDLHMGSIFTKSWLDKIVDKANALNPDIVAITGDFVDGSVKRLNSDLEPLSRLKAAHGVFACVGNHEYYSGFKPWVKALRGMGITLPLNGHVLIRHKGATIALGAVTDIVGESFGQGGPDVSKAFAGSPADAVRILLDHRPADAVKNAGHNVLLQLSGHTHGGQIFPLSLIVAGFNNGFISGLYQVGRMTLYVSPGTGLWGGFPVRLGVPSEITELVLRKKS